MFVKLIFWANIGCTKGQINVIAGQGHSAGYLGSKKNQGSICFLHPFTKSAL
jgi:hypothetical protein